MSKRIHILQWLPSYTKMDAISDFIAGITLGLTMMPQSIAYASLANLPAQYGLYSAFMGSFIYVFFGTIKEVSIGPTSLMALLTLSVCKDLSVDFVILLCFLSGCVQLLMGILKLGFLVDFMSVPVVSGFTSATSIIIVISQLKGLLGISIKSHGIFELSCYLMKNLHKTKLGDTILSIFCITFLLSFKQLTKIKSNNETVKKLLWLLSISRNALIVLITSLIACFCERKWGKIPFKIYGNISGGIPNFQPPPFSTKMGNETFHFIEMVGTLGSGVFIVPIVGVLANVAIAKAFAVGKVVDATQEMITLGLCNIFGSFVQAMPSTGAFTRSAVSNASGVRTPMAGLYSGTLILLALTFLTSYFYYVPTATLSSILISAVLFLIDYEIIPKLWKFNKIELFITFATFTASVVIGVEMGLLFGVMISLIPLLKLWTRPKIDTQIWMLQTGEKCLLVYLELGLLFPAADYLSQKVTELCCLYENEQISIVALDFHKILKLDYSSIQTLQNLQKNLKKKSVSLKFIYVNENVQLTLTKFDEENKLQNFFSNDGGLFDNSYKISVRKICDDIEQPLSQ